MSSSLRTKASAPASSARSSALASSEPVSSRHGELAQRRVEPDAPDHRRAVDAGQHAVDDDAPRARRRRPARRPSSPLPATKTPIARLLQGRLQLLAEGDAVVDDQHGFLRPCDTSPAPRRTSSRARPTTIAGVVGLADVLVGAGRQAADAVAHLGLGRQQHDGRGRGPRHRPDLAQQVDAVAVGQQHVEDDEREGARRRAPAAPRRRSRRRRPCRPASSSSSRQVHAHGQAVVDDEDGGRHRRASMRRCPATRQARDRSRQAASTCVAAPSSAASRGMP